MSETLEIPTGGPAFPVYIGANGDGVAVTDCATTLRDYFAAKAMQGMLADPESQARWGVKVICELSYQYADAMLTARAALSKGQP